MNPDTLRKLAKRLPERFVHDAEGTMGAFSVRYKSDQWQNYPVYATEFITYLGPAARSQQGRMERGKIWFIREALEQEIEARGWHAAYIPTIDATRLAVTIYRNGTGDTLGTGWADKPVEALAAALLSALETEQKPKMYVISPAKTPEEIKKGQEEVARRIAQSVMEAE